ncbi:MAG: hypothetical protein NVS3B12_28810 [Acidimicrobiales bacterium]
MANLIPGAYRGVSVAEVNGSLDAAALRFHFVGREAYRRTRWIAVSNGSGHALIEVHRRDDAPLFAPITSIDVLAGPDETCWLERPELDTGVPAQLARAADDPSARGRRCVVVHGRYGHVSFILDPAPIRIRVVEVVPPTPAKLAEQAQRVLDVAEDLPPIVLATQLFALEDVAPAEGSILLPCRGADIELPGRDTWFLDQRPAHQEWTLLGCARSREIHTWFYGCEPAADVDLCPRRLADGLAGPVLTKCCLLEQDIHVEPGLAVVPWGASLGQIGEAVGALAREAEPAWAPA